MVVVYVARLKTLSWTHIHTHAQHTHNTHTYTHTHNIYTTHKHTIIIKHLELYGAAEANILTDVTSTKTGTEETVHTTTCHWRTIWFLKPSPIWCQLYTYKRSGSVLGSKCPIFWLFDTSLAQHSLIVQHSHCPTLWRSNASTTQHPDGPMLRLPSTLTVQWFNCPTPWRSNASIAQHPDGPMIQQLPNTQTFSIQVFRLPSDLTA